MSWFEAACEVARERFAGSGEYPLIDDDEVIEDRVLFDVWPRYDKRWDSLDEIRLAALTSDQHDLPVRFVYLNLFYRLAHYPAEQIAFVVEDVDEAPEHRERYAADLKSLVGLVDADHCDDARHIRWEIVNACAVQDWHLAGCLYHRLEELAQNDQVAQCLAWRGQHEFLTVFAGPWEFTDPLDLWAPLPGRDWAVCRELSLFVFAVADGPKKSFSLEERKRLEDASDSLKKALRKNRDLDLVYRFLLLRCHLALEQFRDAAREGETLLKRRNAFPTPQLGDAVLPKLHSCIVEACASAGDADLAIRACQRWIEEFPDYPGTYERLSRLYQELKCDYRQAYEYLRKEEDRNPARGEDPAVSLALALGPFYLDPERQWEKVRRGQDPREVELVQTFVGIHWPEARRLEPGIEKEWADGSYLLLRRVPDNPGLAMVAFGKVTENELRRRLFDRFRQTLGKDEIQRLCPAAEKHPLAEYLRGEKKLTFGEMSWEFSHLDQPRTAPAKRFREWLRRENSWLISSLQDLKLDRICDLWNRAKHGADPPLSWEDAEHMATLCRNFLSVILKRGPAPTT